MRGFLAAVVVSVMGLAAPAAQAETLADALASAYRNSQLLDQNEALLRAADEDVAQAVARLRPVISFVAQAQNVESNPNSVQDGLSKTFQLAAQWTILDFGRNRIGVEIAKETVLATREALKGLEAQVLLSAVSAFVDVRLQAEIVALRQSNVRLIGQELQAAKDRFDVGEVTRTDVAIAEARLAAARSGLAAAQGDFKVARERYKAVVGDYPGNLAGLPPLPATAKSMEEARMIALRTHPSILQAQRQVTIAGLGVEATKAAMRPTVDLQGAIRQNLDTDSRTDSLSLSFNQTLYAGGALSSAHRQALANKEAAQANLLQTTITVGENVGNAWSALEVAAVSIQAGTLQVQAAQTAFDGVREEATLGARTTLDVLDAEQELLDARATKLQSEAQRYVGVYNLLATMGLLSVEHLNLGVPTYDPALYYNAVKNAPVTSPQGKKLQRILDKIGD
ncbi:TolC family outer membrane protein [Tabrizicola sp. M-4]|uniref:TolC family outer membrane protein n=1 Tax=Tabrizicola sp. M-4 TaxID=3055847 RepID=UPI003DA8448D